MKVTTLTYHQRSIITTISTFLSVRPVTRMGLEITILPQLWYFFFRLQFLQKNFTGPPNFFFSTILNTKKVIYIEVWRKNFGPKRNSVHETTRGVESAPPPGFFRVNVFSCMDEQSLAVKLIVCQNRCCFELGQYKSVVNTSFESIYSYL